MNFKKYHVSRNLFDGLLIGGLFTDSNFNVSGNADVYKSIKVFLPAGTYTFSWGKNVNFVRLIIDGNYSQPAYNNISSRTITSTTDGYVGISFRDTTSSSTVWDNTTPIMLNSGSTALPYEPYSSEVWHDTPHYIHNTSTDTITTLPAVVYPNAATATVGLKGNMVQSGTPSSQNPITPQETGERTANLFDYSTITTGYRIIWATGALYVDATGIISDFIEVSEGKTYRVSDSDIVGFAAYTIGYDSNKEYLGVYNSVNGFTKASSNRYSSITIPTGYDCKYIKLMTFISNDLSSTSMFTEGSTAPPSYIPYGIKIPISSGGVTTPIYLSEPIRKIGDYADSVEGNAVTRYVKKLVLTGEETSWQSAEASGGRNRFVLNLTGAINADTTNPYSICSHLPLGASGATYTTDNVYTIASTKLYIRLTADYNALADFKAYLAAQYAAGTPVTVWYVLATPTTETITAPTIPTTAGEQTFDVLTSLKPSEVQITYKGWHKHSPKKYENGSWG